MLMRIIYLAGHGLTFLLRLRRKIWGMRRSGDLGCQKTGHLFVFMRAIQLISTPYFRTETGIIMITVTPTSITILPQRKKWRGEDIMLLEWAPLPKMR